MAATSGSGGGGGGGKKRGEVLQFKSPAEFFAENQAIAGFDNPGRALYTTIREFVENALDACESVARLPTITLSVEEMDTETFNRYRAHVHQSSASLSVAEAVAAAGGNWGGKRRRADGGAGGGGEREDMEGGGVGGGVEEGDERKASDRGSSDAATQGYFVITCRDNGCGMPHDKLPDMLGRVLAGSKYGVRQTRGKFGLGAKMALIWSKKSTGLPIDVTTAYAPTTTPPVSMHGDDGGGGSGGGWGWASTAASHAPVPPKVSYCKLDIDVHKNLPHVLRHEQRDNDGGGDGSGCGDGDGGDGGRGSGTCASPWVGTQIRAAIAGAWSSYRARVLQYFQQLAVITPYAQFTLTYANVSRGGSGGRSTDFSYMWRRRSTQIPVPPKEVRHHPSAVNDLLIAQLADHAKEKASTSTLASFLTSHFQCIDRGTAGAIIAACAAEEPGFTATTPVPSLTPKSIHTLRQAMESMEYPPPDGTCLSPAGEYNLRLGIMKEVRPDMVATASSSVHVYQGHPFIVEAGVCLGGRGVEGLTVHRFANRIPLLFEGGADVATQTAMKRVPWGSYKIDVNKDRVGVFVSLVSTKVPFKGTGKEYIGDDIVEIRHAVRSTLQACCSQLRVKLLRASALRARANRRKTLMRYVPDVVRALTLSMQAFAVRAGDVGASVGGADLVGHKRARATFLHQAGTGKFGEAVLTGKLTAAVEKADLDAALEHAAAVTSGLLGVGGGGGVEDEEWGLGGHGGMRFYITPFVRGGGGADGSGGVGSAAPAVLHEWHAVNAVLALVPAAVPRG